MLLFFVVCGVVFLVSIVVCFSLVVLELSSLVSIAGAFLLLFLVFCSWLVSIVGAFLLLFLMLLFFVSILGVV